MTITRRLQTLELKAGEKLPAHLDQRIPLFATPAALIPDITLTAFAFS